MSHSTKLFGWRFQPRLPQTKFRWNLASSRLISLTDFPYFGPVIGYFNLCSLFRWFKAICFFMNFRFASIFKRNQWVKSNQKILWLFIFQIIKFTMTFWNIANLYFWWYVLNRKRFLTYNLCFNWVDNSIDASPLVGVFRLTSDNAETLEDVDNVIDSSSLYAELFCTLIK